MSRATGSPSPPADFLMPTLPASGHHCAERSNHSSRSGGGIVSATSNLANSMALHLEQGRAAYDAMDAQAKLELDGFYQWLEDAR